MSPTTRNSLILRLRDRNDADAWRQFVAIYEPVIARVALRRGMQHANVLDLVQRVLTAVARSVDRFEPDPTRARFRTWLHTITIREFRKEYTAIRKHSSTQDSHWVAALAAPVSDDDFLTEYRRALFRWAADRVRPQCKGATWQAFWRTSVDGRSPEQVAEELELSVGAVYIARSRVMARLREAVAQYEEEQS